MNLNSRNCPLCGTKTKYMKKINDYHDCNYKICMECGFVHQNPIYDLDYYKTLPYETQLDNYDEHAYDRAKYIHEFVKLNYNVKPKNILDIGCGYGGVLYHLKQYYPDAELTGITDRLGDAKYASKYYNLILEVGDAETISFNNNKKYDLIIMSHFLEHIINPIKLLNNINNILSEDGVIYIEVPSLYYAGIRSKQTFVLQHLSYFTKNTLKYLMSLTRFYIVNMHESKYWGNIKLVVIHNQAYHPNNFSWGENKYEFVYMKRLFIKLLYPYYKLIKKFKKINAND